jgi:transposase-like protein
LAYGFRPGRCRNARHRQQRTRRLAAVFRTTFAQPESKAVAATWDEVRDQLAGRFPKIGTFMDAANAEVLAFTAFRRPHSPKIWSTDPIAKESQQGDQRRAHVVDIHGAQQDWSSHFVARQRDQIESRSFYLTRVGP